MCQGLSGMMKKNNITGIKNIAEHLILLSRSKLFGLRVSLNRKYCSVKAYPDKKIQK